MKINRFFISEKIGDKTDINITSSTLVNQLKNVFRFNKGDQIILFDNTGYDFLCSINNFDGDNVSLNRVEIRENVVLPQRETYLFASIVKKDNFEWIVQKATELGVSHIVPIISERSEKKDLNFDRLNKIIIEASEQCGRGTLPIIYEIMKLEYAITKFGHIKSIAWDPEANKFVINDIADIIGAYIGPEGGWTENELQMFKERGIHIRSLGPQVLKSETAVISVLSRLVF